VPLERGNVEAANILWVLLQPDLAPLTPAWIESQTGAMSRAERRETLARVVSTITDPEITARIAAEREGQVKEAVARRKRS
jgi:hypothetical protein